MHLYQVIVQKLLVQFLDNISVVCSEFLVLPKRIKMLAQYHFTFHRDQPCNVSISSACLFLLHGHYAKQTERQEWKQSNMFEMSSERIYCVALKFSSATYFMKQHLVKRCIETVHTSSSSSLSSSSSHRFLSLRLCGTWVHFRTVAYP